MFMNTLHTPIYVRAPIYYMYACMYWYMYTCMKKKHHKKEYGILSGKYWVESVAVQQLTSNQEK